MAGIERIAVFVQEVSRHVGPVRPMEPAPVEVQRVAQTALPQKRLMEVPASPPAGTLPRGSLLDLRV